MVDPSVWMQHCGWKVYWVYINSLGCQTVVLLVVTIVSVIVTIVTAIQKVFFMSSVVQ
jgi:hypothetical protein